MSEPLTPEEEAKFRESVRLLGDDGTLQWNNRMAMRLLATLDAERAHTFDLDSPETLAQALADMDIWNEVHRHEDTNTLAVAILAALREQR